MKRSWTGFTLALGGLLWQGIMILGDTVRSQLAPAAQGGFQHSVGWLRFRIVLCAGLALGFPAAATHASWVNYEFVAGTLTTAEVESEQEIGDE